MEKIERLLSYCGLVCSECPAMVAKRRNDDALRREAAAQWSEQYGAEIKPEDLNCDGCTTRGGEHFSYCGECEVRACAEPRFIDNCAHCPEYGCETLKGFFAFAPVLKDKLEAIRKQLGN